MKKKVGDKTLEIRPSAVAKNSIVVELIEKDGVHSKTWKLSVNELLSYLESKEA